MKVGDLVRAKNPIYFKGIGIVVKDDFNSPWHEAVRVHWFTPVDTRDEQALMRIYDLEPVISTTFIYSLDKIDLP